MLTTKAIVSRLSHSPNGQVTFVYCRPEERCEFLEGQFMMLEVPGQTKPDGKPMKNPYSIATTNQTLQEHGEIGFIVKRASEAGVSDYLTQKIKIGDELMIAGALGHMVDKDHTPKVLLVSVGSGVSPMVGLYNALVHEQDGRRVANVFGESYHEQIVPEVNALFSEQGDEVKNYFHISHDDERRDGYRPGHVQSSLDEALDFLGWDGVEGGLTAFLCGRPDMVHEVEDMLLDRGMTKAYIRTEKY